MLLKFTKMHALGNDFVVIDGVRQDVARVESAARLIADRHRGIGCDQILIAEQPAAAAADFRLRIVNADGSEVGQCGNGARCFAKFLVNQGLTDQRRVTVETLGGLLELAILDDGSVRVDMGVPNFEPRRIPFLASAREERYALEVGGHQVEIGVLSIGNPHAVHRVASVAHAPVAELGPQIERHSWFPERTNAGFMEVVDAGCIKLRVFERGAGETLACGSGACAAAVIGRQWGLLGSRVTVQLPGGELSVEWSGEGSSVFLTGPATPVFEGSISLQ